MKRIIIGAVLSVAVCGAAWSLYTAGYRHGFDRALILQNGTFVGTLDALQKIRAGNVDGGRKRIESLCFSAANTVYSGRPASEFVAKTFLNDFRRYRQTYRSNSAEWTVTEQNLEKKLETQQGAR